MEKDTQRRCGVIRNAGLPYSVILSDGKLVQTLNEQTTMTNVANFLTEHGEVCRR